MSAPLPTPNAAARSLQAFGVYLCIAGAGLLLTPGLLLAPLGLAVPQEAVAHVWVRMVGILALALGVGDVLAGRAAVPCLIHWSVWRRLAAGVGIGLLVLLGLAPAAMLLFAAVDIVAALWTAMALRSVPKTEDFSPTHLNPRGLS
jgi:hypothetical protein